MAKISIEAKQGVYLTYQNYPYKVPQVFGEYIDNAIQSYRDHQTQLKSSNSDYKLRVDIDLEMFSDDDNVIKAKSITVHDNAAGMTSDIFAHAFNLTDDEMTRKGMNEFGIGMKAASAWLGKRWKIETVSIEDQTKRTLDVYLPDIADKQIKELESIESIDHGNNHGTKITISELWPNNVIIKDTIQIIKDNLASIYRNFIREQSIQIYVNGDLLNFEEYEILKAPSYKDPEGEIIEWKKAVYRDDHKGHTISGFIALLKDMSDEKRGVVFTRNGRVVLGFDPKDRTVGKPFMGQVGSAKYRRVFGELEITGFSVAFGKNQLTDSDLKLLEAECKIIASTLTCNGTNLLTQGDKTKKKKMYAPVPKPTTTPTTLEDPKDDEPTVKPSPTEIVTPTTSPNSSKTETESSDGENSTDKESVNLLYGTFKAGTKTYTIKLEESNELPDPFYNDISKISENILTCKINKEHPFFKKFGEPTDQILLLIKALSIAQFKVGYYGSGKVSEMTTEVNSILENITIE